jgi:hypothetical protein
MWCKCIGMALIAGASAMCFPLQAAGQSEIVPPAGTDHPDQQSSRSLFLAQHRPEAFNPASVRAWRDHDLLRPPLLILIAAPFSADVP